MQYRFPSQADAWDTWLLVYLLLFESAVLTLTIYTNRPIYNLGLPMVTMKASLRFEQKSTGGILHHVWIEMLQVSFGIHLN